MNMTDDKKMSHSQFPLASISAASCHELHIAKSVSYKVRQRGAVQVPIVQAVD